MAKQRFQNSSPSRLKSRAVRRSVRSRLASRRGKSSIPKSGGPLHRAIQWTDIIPAGQWATYRQAIAAARNAGVPFLLGGGFSLAIYTGRWRNTKDIDFYILPRDREEMIAALFDAGFQDYYERRAYDPGWIFRSTRDGIIVDIIWSMANRRAEVDALWFDRAKAAQIREESLLILPPEELLWCKLYILQRDHADWTDIFNLLYAAGPKLDWSHVLWRVGPDEALLRAAMTVFFWLCPNRAREFPAGLRSRLALQTPARVSTAEQLRRVKLLDTRAWFASMQPADRPLEV